MEKLVLLLFLLSFDGYGHQGVDHAKHVEQKLESKGDNFHFIDEVYQKNVSSIFNSKCMDCHGEPKSLPWYYALPIAKQIMNADMKEAKVHLDLRGGFPFKGHGTPKEDLKAILDVIEKNEMPPLNYKLIHWNSQLTAAEGEAVKNWVKASLDLLNNEKH